MDTVKLQNKTYEDYKAWYCRADVKFQLIKNTRNREVAFLSKHEPKQNIRTLKIHSVQHFDYVLKTLNVFWKQKHYNMYYSLAEYEDGIPNQQFFDMQQRTEENRKWKEHHWRKIKTFDYLIDFDGADHSDNAMTFARESAIALHEDLLRWNCPHKIRFSGMGFHIIIPGTALPALNKDPWAEDLTQYKHYNEVMKAVYERYSEMTDDSLADSRRVTKIPYSLAVYPGGTMLVCTPLNTTEELKTFTLRKAYISEHPDIRFNKEHTFCERGNAFRMLEELGVLIHADAE